MLVRDKVETEWRDCVARLTKALQEDSKGFAHLNNLRLFFEVRMEVSIALS